MSEYYIIPKANWQETVEANSAEEAIVNFATSMDMDMNIYFDVVSKEDYESYKLKRDLEESKRQFLEFAEEVLEDDFDELDADDKEVSNIAEYAWDLYCGNRKGGEGLTEYECIELAISRWEEEDEYRFTKDLVDGIHNIIEREKEKR